MNKTAINTFVKGMVKDVDKSVQSKDSYLDALNFRVVTSEGYSSGAFENVKGNKILGENTFSLSGGLQICGSVRLRDYLILFITTNTDVPVHGVGRSFIAKVQIDTVNEDFSGEPYLLYEDSSNAGGGSDTLDFSTLYPIKAIAKYETPNIQKVYFTDGYNHLRYMNVSKDLTITGEAYTSGNFMDTSMFELLPMFYPSLPVLSDIVAGSLNSGMVQYSYQLYKVNGASTAFSPVGQMIHVVSSKDIASNDLDYKGDVDSVNTGKGLKIFIANYNEGYNRLRLVRLYYSTLNSIPTITVCNEIEINPAGGDVYVIDDGGTINSLTLDEFNISSTELFTCEDIATKDNRLFAANVNKSDFKSNLNVDDWDCRAVRFRDLDNTAYIFDGGSQVVIDNTFSNWDEYTFDHDGVNNFNNPEYDTNSNYGFKYQSNGSTIGAEGPNVKIGFGIEEVTLDDSTNKLTFSTTSGGNIDDTDLSYKDYASPWKGNKLSWQRDEVYRLFVVCGNDRAQTSIPKWIIDLRMPSLHEEGYSLLASSEISSITTTRLYPTIQFSYFPEGVTWVQIYRVKRGRADRFVVTQGIGIPSLDTQLDSANQEYSVTPYPGQLNNTIESYNEWSTGDELIKIVSPEILINGNISSNSNDYVEHVYTYSTEELSSYVNNWMPFHAKVYKEEQGERVPYEENNISPIDGSVIIPPSSSTTSGIITLNGKQYNNYNREGKAKGCTGLLVAYTNSNWTIKGNRVPLINYKCNVFSSQYGGQTYEDRLLNVSIPCSDIMYDINYEYNIEYGDTFINYFDVSTLLYDLSVVVNTQNGRNSLSESIYFPVESSINCNLRSDTFSAHLNYANSSPEHSASTIRQEYAGSHLMATGTGSGDSTGTSPIVQELNLYVYNTVYSQESTAQYAMSSMLDLSTETSFDCLVKASNIKYNGENSDSWTKFNINEEIEVDSNYGPIRAIDIINDKLAYWQEDAFGILSVNTRSLIQDSSSAQLALGTGGILDRYDYISNTVGILNKFSKVISDTSVYWFYDKDTSIYRFNNKLSNLSKEKGMWSWFNNNYNTSQIVHGIYDREYNEILFTFYGLNNGTIGFSEQTDEFEPFRSFVPRMYIDGKEFYLSITDDGSNTPSSLVYYHNSNISPRCEFYGDLYPSTIKLIINGDYLYTKVFDNVSFISSAFDEETDIEQYSITFDRIRCYNDYQSSGWVDLTYPTNIMRRDRGWTATVPRNIVDHDLTTGPDIFQDLDTAGTTKVWKERIRDKYMILDLSFDNTSDTRFVVPFIGVKYRLSYR